MNVFRKVTVQSLRKNRIRTIVTIIGVILSVALITGVTTFIYSLQKFMINNVIETDGNWHMKISGVDNEFLKKLSDNKDVEFIAREQVLGYSLHEGIQNETKPYIYVSGFSNELFDILPLEIISGRKPENSNELLISEHLETNGGVKLKVGDTITLDIGDRLSEGEKLGQRDAFFSESSESISVKYRKTYTVVGICIRPEFEGYSAPGYTAVTAIDPNISNENIDYTAYMRVKNLSKKIYDFAPLAAGEYSYDFNGDFLRYSGVSGNDNFNSMLYSLGAVLISIIMIGSILLINNSFSISVNERTRQFGILASVGATKKQIRKSVLFEGICIGIIGIPLGILSGIGGIGVTLYFVDDIFNDMLQGNAGIGLSVSVFSVVCAAFIGIATILISAYIPARRSSRVSPIDAIRQTADIKINGKKVKTAKITEKIFGLEGTLALKNFKRNKKRYRSTVISLFVSIVLFISASSFAMYLKEGTGTAVATNNYDIAFWSNEMNDDEALKIYERMKNAGGVYKSGYYKEIFYFGEIEKNLFSERFISEHQYDSSSTNIIECGMVFMFIDDDAYFEYARNNGIDPKDCDDINSLIATTNINYYDYNEERFISYNILKEKKPFSASLSIISETGEKTSFGEIKIKHITDIQPETVPLNRSVNMTVYAPYSLIGKYNENTEYSGRALNLTFLTTDHKKSETEIYNIINSKNIPSSEYIVRNVAEAEESSRNFVLVIEIFIYGFIILISLITIANIFNTISTNINLRRRELAMLKSVGMTDKRFQKMMNFECVLYGLKALLYGLPTAFALNYLIYRSILIGEDIEFSLPWVSIAVSVFSVFFVVFVTMLYSIRKIKKENTVDVLRNDIL